MSERQYVLVVRVMSSETPERLLEVVSHAMYKAQVPVERIDVATLEHSIYTT